MPKKIVVQMTCDRCARVWYPEVKKEIGGAEVPEPTTPSAAVVFRDAQGTEVVKEMYETLCESCSKTVQNYLAGVAKNLKNRSPRRSKKKDGEAEASPPKPVTPPGTPGMRAR